MHLMNKMCAKMTVACEHSLRHNAFDGRTEGRGLESGRTTTVLAACCRVASDTETQSGTTNIYNTRSLRARTSALGTILLHYIV